MKIPFRRISYLWMLVLAMLALASCKKEGDPVVVGPLTYRVINAASGTVDQDFFQRNNKLNVAPIPFGQPAVSLTGVSGLNSITFTDAGTLQGNASIDVFLTAGSVFNIFLAKAQGDQFRIFGMQNDQNKAGSGKIKLRFLNLVSTTQSALSINTASGANVQSDVLFAREYNYNELDATVNLVAVLAGSLESIEIPATAFQATHNYTVWFDTDVNGSLRYFVTKDNLGD